MSSKLDFGQLSRGRQLAIVGAGLLAIALISYLLLVSPRRSQASDLKAQTAQVQAQITRNLSSPTPLGRVLPADAAADIFQLTKAMPTDVNMADVIIELNQLADATGLSFDQISPQALLMGTTYNVQPINLSFTGNYYNLLDFLFRVRNLVGVYGNSPDTTFRDRNLLGLRGGKLYSTGRMYSVSKVSFAEAYCCRVAFFIADSPSRSWWCRAPPAGWERPPRSRSRASRSWSPGARRCRA